ncbi:MULTISPECIES: hypothetical protein [unclassified Thioalkalivibrio]|uniref:hypothetical protein n=1 Tax=unclassified Thioalkalivibrio TaxID=2621013 RepID=UPI000475AE78|nr:MULTISPECIES: hypothetical protein [unclassified Thioalkalivibrio]
MRVRVDGGVMRGPANSREGVDGLAERSAAGALRPGYGRSARSPAALLAVGVVMTLIVTGGCMPSGEEERSSDDDEASMLAPLDMSEESIRTVEGTTLLRIDDLPGDIQVDEQNAFGAATRFREARASPDNTWVAVVTSGAAHSAGWLVQADSGEAFPAAFQYGGSVTIGLWSDDGRHVVFAQEGPAGNRTLTVVDRESLGDSVEANAIPVRVDDHGELDPEDQHYEALGWEEGSLRFRLGDEPWVFDPATGAVEAE